MSVVSIGGLVVAHVGRRLLLGRTPYKLKQRNLLCNRPQGDRTHIILLAIKSTSPPYTRTKWQIFTTNKERNIYARGFETNTF